MAIIPTKPTKPLKASRFDRDTFLERADPTVDYLFGAVPDYVEASNTFIDGRANDALAAALGGDLPPITGKALQFLRVNAGGTAAEFAPVEMTKATEAQAEAGTGTGLMDATLTKAAIDAQVPVLAMPKIATWTHSTNVTSLTVTDLGDWDQIEVEFVALAFTNGQPVAGVSFDNGSTWQTTGYLSTVTENGGSGQSTTQIRITRLDATSMSGSLTMSSMSASGVTVARSHVRRGGTDTHSGTADTPSGVVNAIRFYDVTFTGGTINIYGVRRA